MIDRIVATVTIIGLFLMYYYSTHPSRDVLLASALVVAIGEAATRIRGDRK